MQIKADSLVGVCFLGAASPRSPLGDGPVECDGAAKARSTSSTCDATKRPTGGKRRTKRIGVYRPWRRRSLPIDAYSFRGYFRFKIDRTAKARGVPFEKLRGWSSETLDYRVKPGR